MDIVLPGDAITILKLVLSTEPLVSCHKEL